MGDRMARHGTYYENQLLEHYLLAQGGLLFTRLLCFDIRAGESSRGDEHLLFGK